MNRGFALWLGILGALQVIAGGAGLADFIGEKWALGFVFIVGALQAGTGAFQRGLVTPVPGGEATPTRR